ncbi:MAG: 2-phospho-L-lactate guanylyltransferase [Acidimicrobiales bacterium]
MQTPTADTVVLIPIRSFDDSKSRLAGALDHDSRRRLTMRMAARVIAAARDLPVRIVTDDSGVVDWAHGNDVGVLSVGVTGLNPSVTAAVAHAARVGYTRAIVAHADLPAALDLSVVAGPGVRIAPDRARDGSNVMCVPTDAGFAFAYGPESFRRHCAEAERLGLPLTVVDDDSLAWDVDDPDDLPHDWEDWND